MREAQLEAMANSSGGKADTDCVVEPDQVKADTDSVVEPDQLVCSITHVMFRDPVFVPESGNTYEREAIMHYWQSSQPPRDPLTNSVLETKALHTNWGVRREVQRFLDANPTYIPQGWQSREVPPPIKPNAIEKPLPQLQYYCQRVLLILVAMAGFYSLMSWSGTESTDVLQEHLVGEASGVQFLSPPKGSKLQVSSPDTSKGQLSVWMPPSKRLSGDALGQVAFAILWLGFTAMWTMGAVRGGAPVSFCLFSVPFWGAGIIMLANVGKSVFAGERLLLTPGFGGKGNIGNLWTETTIFGWSLSHVNLELGDLQKPPQRSCVTGLSCQLVFETANEDVSFGTSTPLKRDEAQWLQTLMSHRLVIIFRDAGLSTRHVEGPLSERQRQHNPHSTHNGEFGGIGTFGFGPGFTFVIR